MQLNPAIETINTDWNVIKQKLIRYAVTNISILLKTSFLYALNIQYRSLKEHILIKNYQRKVKIAKYSRSTYQAIGDTVPVLGALHQVEQEKEETIIEIIAPLNLQDDAIAERVENKKYQSLNNRDLLINPLLLINWRI